LDPKTYKKWYEEFLKKEGEPFFPYAAWRDVLFGSIVVFGILALGFWIGAPELQGEPNPAEINVAPRPDWYLLWIFAIFALMPTDIESYMMVLGPLVIFGILFSIPFLSNKGERHALRRPWAIAGVVFTVTIVATFWHAGTIAPWAPDFKTKKIPASVTFAKPELVKKGASLFYSKGCLYCHKINNLGGLRGPDLTIIQNRLTHNEIIIRIINGGENMPAFGGSLKEEELKAIVAFLESDK
jgi:ubiquinol-cytochrome c reductase cytochrome b subunit